MTDALAGRVSLRPVFVSSLESVSSPLWPTPLWRVPDGAGVQPGAFAFTTTGEFAGIAIVHAGRRVLVPPPVMFGEIDRLIETAPATAGDIGVSVQALTPDLSTATGASSGVVVSAVDPSGPVGQHLKVADVIAALNGKPIGSVDEWQTLTNRLVVSEPVALRVLRAGSWLDLNLRAPSPTKHVRQVTLGLRLRHVAGTGAEVLAVQPGSAGARAGLAPGDFVTLVGTINAPTPAQIQSAFNRTPEGLPLVLAYTRGRLSIVTTLAR
jgi:S1-C subfamily serine protease